jgi:hypothetical protein
MRIYTNSITNAVFTILSSWTSFINSNVGVHHLPFMNTDPSITPWIGVFRPRIDYDPLRSNIISPYNVQMTIPVFTQYAFFGDVLEPGMLKLQELDAEVFTAVSCYRSLLDSVVEIWKGGDITPYNEDRLRQAGIISSQHQLIVEVFG